MAVGDFNGDGIEGKTLRKKNHVNRLDRSFK